MEELLHFADHVEYVIVFTDGYGAHDFAGYSDKEAAHAAFVRLRDNADPRRKENYSVQKVTVHRTAERVDWSTP